ncbi:hypothetical protein Bbelb_406210 [Branchiostoma belcheri]|nr:hypothetical protein Bbelb_406210 [Branchiostoma belcheri]
MLQAGAEFMADQIASLTNAIIKEERIPNDWNLSYIINCYKGKGDPLERGNYRGLKLLDQVLKVVERVLEPMIREQVHIDSMQFGFTPGRGTTDAIFILRQLQEKFLSKRKDLYFMFVDLEKAFDRVPREVLWWAMRKLGVQEWLVRVVQSMYCHARSSVRINGSYSSEFDVRVGVHQGSVLSPLLFIIVMEALSRGFRTGCPWEMLYADDLGLAAETLMLLAERFCPWQNNLSSHGLRVNTGKTMVVHCKYSDTRPVKETGKFPCGVCRKGVGENSIFCPHCQHWIHKKCTSIKGKLKEDPNFICRQCHSNSPSPVQPTQEVTVAGETFKVVPTFCYLGDMIGQSGGCTDAVTARIKTAWKSFHELLPILADRSIPFINRGHVFNSCVRSVMLYGSETWAVSTEDLRRLDRCDNAMIRWICSSRLADRVSSDQLRCRLGVSSLREILRYNRLRWYGHVQRMDPQNWPRKVMTMPVEGRNPRGRPKKRWIDSIREDVKNLKLQKANPLDRSSWRAAIRPKRHPTTSNPCMTGNNGR